ncbi:hypothetical protein [Chitinophaga sp.]|uniref:hypothetical protein n=1 Tax=Chitinophaga sp. TaxID=1869181 RepID=UPI0031E0FB52
MTLNNLINLLRSYAQSHLQINDFGSGDLSDLAASKDVRLPVMWVSYPTGRYSQNQMFYNLTVFLADQIFDDKKNELEVQSDMLSIALDTFAFLRDNPGFDFQVDADATIDFFTERFGELTAGCAMSFTLRDPKPLDRCVIPFD